MREVSVGGAISAGFRLVRREPLAFLAWALVYGLVGILPQFLGMATSFNAMSTLGAAGTPAAMADAMAPLQRLQPITILTSSLSALLLYGAVYRAALYPDDRRFLYLRLGARELWMGLTFVTVVFMSAIGIFAMMIPFILIIGISAAAGAATGGVGALIAIPLMFAAFGVFVWAAMRIAVAMPMAFAERGFRIPEAWRLSRGYAGRIFLVMLALFGLLVLAEVLLFALGAGVFSLFMPLSEMGRMFTQNPAQLFSRINPAVWAAVAVVWALLGAASVTLFSAALAQIYSDLAGPDTAEIFS